MLPFFPHKFTDDAERDFRILNPSDNHVEMDCGKVKDGDVDPCDEPPLPFEELSLCQYLGLTVYV